MNVMSCLAEANQDTLFSRFCAPAFYSGVPQAFGSISQENDAETEFKGWGPPSSSVLSKTAILP